MLNKANFEKSLKKIATTADELADMIHQAGLYALQQVNEHRNTTPANELLDAMGLKHDRQRVATWMMRFSTMRVNKNALIAGDNKRLVDPKWIEQADKTPYWVLTPQPVLKGKLDILVALKSIIKRHDNAVADDSKEWKFFNEDLLKDIETLIAKKENKAVPENVFLNEMVEQPVDFPKSKQQFSASVRAH